LSGNARVPAAQYKRFTACRRADRPGNAGAGDNAVTYNRTPPDTHRPHHERVGRVAGLVLAEERLCMRN
jgi:hypothetical protein